MESRIRLILKVKNITAAVFADKIGVQRSAVSHILSGRNNPSLDFMQRILKTYPDISSDWLINGKGEMNKDVLTLFNTEEYTQAQSAPKLIEKQTKSQTTIFSNPDFEPSQRTASVMNKISNANQIVEEVGASVTYKSEPKQVIEKIEEVLKTPKKIQRIVMFYDDKTFGEYQSE
ncbi:MAG: helix-turn-helix transcriptional regulator [Bacteroidota bacterium]